MNLARFDMGSSPATRTEPPSGRRVVPGGSLHAGLGRGLSKRRLVTEGPPAWIADRSFSDPKTALNVQGRGGNNRAGADSNEDHGP